MPRGKPRPGIFGTVLDSSPTGFAGGTLPSMRTAYSYQQRLALWRLAESNPTPERYHRERARILESIE